MRSIDFESDLGDLTLRNSNVINFYVFEMTVAQFAPL